MLIGKDYLHYDSMPCKFLVLIDANVLLHCPLSELIWNSSSISY